MLRGYFALVSYFQIKTGEFTRTTLSKMRGGSIVTFSSPGGSAVEDVFTVSHSATPQLQHNICKKRLVLSANSNNLPSGFPLPVHARADLLFYLLELQLLVISLLNRNGDIDWRRDLRFTV